MVFSCFAVWAVLCIGGMMFFAFEKDVSRKRLYYPRYILFTGAAFILFVGLTTNWTSALFFFPFIALTMWLNIRVTRFCDGCGRAAINRSWWTTMEFCPHCGRKLPK